MRAPRTQLLALTAVAKRSSPRRGRSSRKRRQGAQPAPAEQAAPGAAIASSERRPSGASGSGRDRRGEPRGRPAARGRPDLEERPRAPWHPFPLSELLILVGMVAAIIGATRGESGLPALLAGLGAVMVGTIDFTLREHRSGFRSHAALLAALPTALLHGILAIGLLALGAPSPSWVIAPVLIDVPVFAVLYKSLRRALQRCAPRARVRRRATLKRRVSRRSRPRGRATGAAAADPPRASRRASRP